MIGADLSYSCEEPDGVHDFPEVEITEDDEEPGVLRAGMKVIIPCTTCGMPPLEQMNGVGEQMREAKDSLGRLVTSKAIPLFHWAPSARRGQIVRYGLRPRMRPTATDLGEWKAPYVCLGDSPRWAWLLSGAQRGTPAGQWDLWETSAGLLQNPDVLGSYEGRGIHEVRVPHRIYKRDLWLVAHRWKDE